MVNIEIFYSYMVNIYYKNLYNIKQSFYNRLIPNSMEVSQIWNDYKLKFYEEYGDKMSKSKNDYVEISRIHYDNYLKLSSKPLTDDYSPLPYIKIMITNIKLFFFYHFNNITIKRK